MGVRRRSFLRNFSAALLGLHIAAFCETRSSDEKRIKIGACDWSLGALASLEAFAIAKQIGLDGVQVSLGTVGDQMKLRQARVQQEYLKTAKETNLAIASVALGELNRVPLKSDPRAAEWLCDAITTAKQLGCEVILVPFFGDGDIKQDLAGRKEVCRRLREIAPVAERHGVILGIESWLSAEEHVEIIDQVGSSAVKVYYDVANSWQMGYPVPKEIRWLGKKGMVCEMHMKENGALLGEGVVDFKAVWAAMEEVGYRGWVQIEGSIPRGMDVVTAYRRNLAFLRNLFGVE